MPTTKNFTDKDVTRERWLRGRLDYKLHAGQLVVRERIRSAKGQLFVGECARQFGKTYERVIAALEKAFQKPKARIKIGTAFHSDLIEFILPAFDAALDDCPEDLRPKFKVQGSKFIVYNLAEIKLVGLDRKPNGLRGNKIDMIVLDEAGFISNLDYLYKSVIIPATTHSPDCVVSMISTPPSTPAHSFVEFAEKAEVEDSYCRLTIYDNPMVNNATIQRLMKESGGAHSSTWRREYLCERILDDNLAIVGEWRDEYVEDVERDDYYPFYHKYVAMDLGVSDHTAVIYAYYDFLKATLVIEDEFVINGPTMNTRILQALIKDRELINWSPGYRSLVLNPDDESKQLTNREMTKIEDHWEYHQPKTELRVSDNNNPLLLQDLSHLHRIHFTPTDKGTLEEMTNALKLIVGRGQIRVKPQCKQTKGCLKYGVWNAKRSEFARSKVYGHFDALAALIYLVRNLNKATNPIPASFQVDFNNQILFKTNETSSVKDLRKAFGLSGKR